MSWFRRIFLVLPLALAACGYTPVYGPGSGTSGPVSSIDFADPSSRDGFLLVQHMERRLGRASDPAYRLDYTVSQSTAALAISVSGARARYNILGTVNFSLVDLETGQTVLSDQATDFTAYSAAGTTIATFAAQQDAVERLMVALGDRVISRLEVADLP